MILIWKYDKNYHIDAKTMILMWKVWYWYDKYDIKHQIDARTMILIWKVGYWYE